jgi:anti-anti-sigma factor
LCNNQEQKIMALTATSTIENGVAKIILDGEVDTTSAPAFQAEVAKAVDAKAIRLVLLMEKLTYMSSAGLRVLMFAKQKMGTNVDIYMVGMQEAVQETLEKTGFDQGVIIVNEYNG